MAHIFFILFSAALINNFVLSRFLGICPFVGVSGKQESSIGMGLAVTVVMVVASIVTWFIQKLILDPLNAGYLQTIFFILVIASLVQFLEAVINKTSPALKSMLGIYLPLITTNCAVLGVTVLNITDGNGLFDSILYSLGGGLGFLLSLVLMAGIRERLEESNVPKYFKGVPITFITGGIMSLAFIAFGAF